MEMFEVLVVAAVMAGVAIRQMIQRPGESTPRRLTMQVSPMRIWPTNAYASAVNILFLVSISICLQS